MVSRKKHIIRNLKKCKLDFKFYSELCDILNVYNDLEKYFQIKMNGFESTSLMMDIAYTMIKNVDIESLLHMYPIYLKDHIHFNIFSQKFHFFKSNFSRYFKNNIIQNNEWEENFFEYCTNQAYFLKENSKYSLDYRELRKISKDHDLDSTETFYPDKIEIDRYFEIYSKKITSKQKNQNRQ